MVLSDRIFLDDDQSAYLSYNVGITGIDVPAAIVPGLHS